MRTLTTIVYSFDELTEEQQKAAHAQYINKGGADTTYIYDEAHETVKRFHEIFGTEEGLRSWLDINTGHIEDDICDLKGIRLRTYIENNFGDEIRTGRYYSLWSKTDQNPHYTEGGHAPKGKLKTRHSKVMTQLRNCPLTGVCYDESILDPVYNLIENFRPEADPDHYKEYTFQNLMEECIQELEKDIESEVESTSSMEYFQEHAEANEYEFTEDGEQI